MNKIKISLEEWEELTRYKTEDEWKELFDYLKGEKE